MKSKIITCSLVAVLSAIFITSCKKENKNEELKLPDVSKTASKLSDVKISEKNSELDKIAKQLAFSLKQKEM